MASVFNLILAHVVLLAPGWLLARLLRSPLAVWLAAPIGQLLLVTVVLAVQLTGRPITFAAVLACEVALTAALAAAWWRWGRSPDPLPSPASPPADAASERWVQPLAWAGVVVVGIIAAVRGCLAPLWGSDTPFRWALLGEQMLAHRTLDFYPPLTGPDFAIYFHPDGIPPLISAAFWWLWAAWGTADWPIVMPLLLMQWASLLALLYHIGRRLDGRVTGLLAVVIAGLNYETIAAALFGQETGLQLISLLGMLVVMLGARPGDPRAMVLTGLLAAVGVTSREYGWAWVPLGAAMAMMQRRSWRELAVLVSVAVIAGAPWYVRNFVRCGNPFYSLSIGPLTGVNPVYNMLLAGYHDQFTLVQQVGERWYQVGGQLLAMLPMHLTVGIAGIVIWARRLKLLWLVTAATLGLWLISVGYTAGGLAYSIRTLTPAVGALGIAAAMFTARMLRRPRARPWVMAAMIAWVIYSAMHECGYPYIYTNPLTSVASITIRDTRAVADRPMADAIRARTPRGSRILAENAYLHALLVNTGWDLVPIWSPEVAFLFNDRLTEIETRRMLLDRGISYVLVYPLSSNTPVCQRYAFMQRADAKWQLIAEQTNLAYLMKLNPPP